jgi:rhodanese-related sulfurtransferase
MLTDGELMRLSKADFKALMVEPMLKAVSYATVSEQIAQHAWQLIDVRLESEFKSGHLEGAINIPLSLIRLRALRLSKEKPVVMCCDTGRRSGAAAFIMGAAGFDAYVLEGGIRTLLSEKRQAG